MSKETAKSSGKLRTYRVEGRVFHEASVQTSRGYEGAAEAFRDTFGAMPEAINDREVHGTCEDCGGILFVSSAYHSDDNGVMWHKRCPKSRKVSQ